jgi:hypothetical protein
MTNILLTRSVRQSPPVRHILVLAALAIACPATNSWADAIKLTSHSFIRGQAVDSIVTARENEVFFLVNFADSSDSLGPVTLSRAGSGSFLEMPAWQPR